MDGQITRRANVRNAVIVVRNPHGKAEYFLRQRALVCDASKGQEKGTVSY
jgi:hypothetical protein